MTRNPAAEDQQTSLQSALIAIAAEAGDRYRSDLIARSATMTAADLERELEGMGYEDLINKIPRPAGT